MPRLTGLTIVIAALFGSAGGVAVGGAQATPPTPPLLWVDGSGRPTAQALQALALFDTAGQHGLTPEHYRPSSPVSQGARFDNEISLGLLRYLQDLHLGRVDGRALGYQLSQRTDAVDLSALVREAAAGRPAEVANTLVPRMRQYAALQQALAAYRGLAAAQIPPPLPASTKVIRLDDSFPGAAALRTFLIALGDMPPGTPDTSTEVFTQALSDGVRRFQQRHGLTVDGTLGPATQAALRVSIPTRVRQVELSLERMRWLPRDPQGPALVVNIPMFRLWSWEAVPARTVPPVDMKVIVGRARNTPTPVFAADLDTVVFRPYWNVPRSILINETLPALRKDSRYLAKNGMEIVRGDGDRPEIVPLSPEALSLLAQGALRVRQRPGPQNSLGLIKFVFPNAMSVFMHGTPAPKLFERERRDLSHGCVRVEDPVALAEWVLNSSAWSREAILKATEGTDSRSVPVAPSIRVVLFYATAAVMPDGAIHFANDLYGHDAALSRALAAPRPAVKQSLLADGVLVTWYGNPRSTKMGALGEQQGEARIARFRKQADAYAAVTQKKVLMAYHLVAVVAQCTAGGDQMWRRRETADVIHALLDEARANGFRLVLDIQVGRSSVAAEVAALAPFLREPDVDLALDPEFAMTDCEIPGRTIGSMRAADVNGALDTLEKIIAEHRLPPKVLIVHQFRLDMLPDKAKIRTSPVVDTVLMMDGFGSQSLKLASYRAVMRQPLEFAG
ncbi:MAG: L,D-transpeptidase family protein, partial [Acidobacteria bacterium]|nr:L,D-transpeptidase family protein [Acidobacteriota bacterium]